MTRVENQNFLTEVSKLLTQANESQSSLYFTQKRYIPFDEVTGRDLSQTGDIQDTVKDSNNYAILIRATNGASDKSKKIKYSTVVEVQDLENFWKDYANVLKNGVTGLKKKDKKKSKKKKIKKDGVSK